jgi:hypothetical protein
MKLKQIIAPAIIASVAFGTFAGASAAGPERGSEKAPPQKVAMCHGNGEGETELISVSVHAALGHAMHGDGVPGTEVSGQDGYVYDDDCSPVSAGVAAGCYDSISFYDLKFNGKSATVDNSYFFKSLDGSCTGIAGTPMTLVEAPDQDSAVPSCKAAGAPSNTALSLAYFGFNTLPETAWLCQ